MFKLFIQGEMFASESSARSLSLLPPFSASSSSSTSSSTNADFLEGLFRKVPSSRETFRIFEGS